ncbi:carbohydrate ABC transporter permease [Mangrovihabitans endophyticus]|uniref:ABC transporter permease n=1 Tax=Mangrovihabitans endophyticus TaxID=1751298 RepID=A0A8J3BXR8_9ACTN|nr:carbohydrate ABC transporter permease [Mangrovihabitans endophyticus]GGK77669.1 ABC transporter permease [Mangrovihabitans endophyticus]
MVATARPAPVRTAARPVRQAARRGTGLPALLYATAAVLAALVFLVPLLWALMRSVQPDATITGTPSWSTFFDLTTENFRRIAADGHLIRATLNSLLVSGGTALLTTVVATAAGYGFGRFRFAGSSAAFGLILLTLMVPFQAILTPLFMQMNAMRLTDSLLGLVLFYTTVNLPFGVFVMRTAFLGIPDALEDAALIDGAGRLRTLASVLRPLILPGMATTALYAFLTSWTEFLGALTFLTRQDLYTLPVALVNLQQGAYGQVDYGLLAAGAVLAMIPCVILFVSLQRFYVAGLSAGAVKG